MAERSSSYRHIAIGDIRGAFRALEQVLDYIEYDPQKDALIFLGDLVDGWPDSMRVVDFMLNSPGLKYQIRGEHDVWFQGILNEVIEGRLDPKKPGDFKAFNRAWWMTGGEETYNAYDWDNQNMLKYHLKFFQEQFNALMFERLGCALMHGGWNLRLGFRKTAETDKAYLRTDKEVWQTAAYKKYIGLNYNSNVEPMDSEFEKFFITHTPVINTAGLLPECYAYEPVQASNVININTHAAMEGRLTAIDIVSQEYVMSDFVYNLYSETERADSVMKNMLVSSFYS